MEGAEEINREKFNLSRRANGVSRDLPHKLMYGNNFPNENEGKREEEDESIELSLGLSLNGRFGFDPAAKKLKRSSSVSNVFSAVDSFDYGSCSQARGVALGSHAPLERTCSLPAETDGGRRTKELQSLRCTEARKKRMEKLKNVRVVRDKESCSGDGLSVNGLHEDVNASAGVQRIDSGLLLGFENWNPMPSSQGPNGSARNSSSRVSDLPDQMMEATKQISAKKSSSTLQFQGEETVQMPTVRAAGIAGKGDGKVLKNALLDMPYVSTKLYGPNCTKVEGFLYRYEKGEDVKILCVCHGLFLSPAEFVKHGGGGDVTQPLKHILVNPFPFL